MDNHKNRPAPDKAAGTSRFTGGLRESGVKGATGGSGGPAPSNTMANRNKRS